MVEAELKRKDR